jgi:hypothetical protein
MKFMLQKELGLEPGMAANDSTQMFYEFESPRVPGHIKYLDIEADYKEYIDQLRKNNRLPVLTSMPEIFRILQRFT